MRTVEYLFSAGLWEIYWPPVVAGLAIVLMCGVLSPLVVVKRLAFVGQGVSHSAFGGIGVAALLAALVPSAGTASAEFGVIIAFCIAAALGMAAAADRRTVQFDTAIGVFLVASMALGAVLVEVARSVALGMGNPLQMRGWESILFGSILALNWGDVALSWGLAAAVVGAAWWVRRPLIFWAFDEASSPAFGVRAPRMKTLLMVLLAVAVVTAMKLAGVILATALLVLPGATALKLSDRLAGVVGWSCALGVGGLLAGLVLSFEADMPPGASIVLVMTGIFGAVWAGAAARGGRTAGA